MLTSPAPPRMESSRWRPSIEKAPNCPRCASSNTKFCYFNNYSLSQPRYFCKSCRRYWTKGGSLRNVPVGGGCRKARRSRASSRPTPPQHSTAPVSEDRDDDPHNHETHGCDIDMALVFANFLNQNATTASHQHLDDEANSMTSNATTHSDPHVVVGGRIPEEELSGIDQVEGLLGGDELAAQDVFWSDATTSSSFASRLPLMPSRQELELELELEYSMVLGLPFHEDAQFPISSSMNSTSDDWSWSSLI